MLSKVIVSKECNYFEDEVNKFYTKYDGCDIDVQFFTEEKNNDIIFIAFITVRGEQDNGKK